MEDYIIKRLDLFDDVICDLWGYHINKYSDLMSIALICFRDLLESDKLSIDILIDRVIKKVNSIIESNL